MGTDLDHADEAGLPASRIEEFIERGYLVLRGCLPGPRLRELARRTMADKDPMPTYRDRGEEHDSVCPARFDLTDASTWPRPNLYLDTQRTLSIAELSPELWAVLRTLVGRRHFIDRRTMGEQLILNGQFRPPPRPALTPEYLDELYWHIDEPSPTTTLRGRRDALVLLVLWSKVEPGGGGTLFSGESLDRVVHQLEESPDGIDTTDYGWGTAIGRECGDVFEFTGDVGDVLISHAFALHAAHPNYGRRIRVLENPTITIRGVLDYSLDNPDPSPVEACVIRRRSGRAKRPMHPKMALVTGAKALLRGHPDYFLPGRAAWQARTDRQERERVQALDAGLWAAWAKRVTELVELRGQGVLGTLKVVLAIVRELFVDERHCGTRVTESIADPGFERAPWARLVRGMVNAEGHSYALATILARLFERVELVRLPGPGPGHVLTRVSTAEGWAFVDAWLGSPFFVASMGGEPIPGLPEHAELLDSGHPGIRFGREDYEAGRGIPFVVPPRPEVDLKELIAAVDRPGPPATDVWSRFIAARIDQLVGDRASAHRGYAELLRRLQPSTTTARVARIFEQRTGSEHYALDF